MGNCTSISSPSDSLYIYLPWSTELELLTYTKPRVANGRRRKKRRGRCVILWLGAQRPCSVSDVAVSYFVWSCATYFDGLFSMVSTLVWTLSGLYRSLSHATNLRRESSYLTYFSSKDYSLYNAIVINQALAGGTEDMTCNTLNYYSLVPLAIKSRNRNL